MLCQSFSVLPAWDIHAYKNMHAYCMRFRISVVHMQRQSYPVLIVREMHAFLRDFILATNKCKRTPYFHNQDTTLFTVLIDLYLVQIGICPVQIGWLNLPYSFV